MKADFHGAKIKGTPFLLLFLIKFVVERSKCPNLVGISGILIQETENTMKVVTEDNLLKGNFFLFRKRKRCSRTISYT